MSKTTLNQSSSDSICIATPCSMDWDSMKGTDEVRLCSGCDKNVYNISAMSRKRVEEILSMQQLPCLQIQRRADGTLVTDEFPKILKPLRSQWKKTARLFLFMVAVFAPQIAAAEDKLKNYYLRGRSVKVEKSTPAQTSPDVSKAITVPHATAGVPIYPQKLLEQRNPANFWPAPIAGLGISKEELPTKMFQQFSPAEIAAVDSKKFEMKNFPPQLDQTAWELFYKARKLHLKASMYFVNKEMDKALQNCQESQKSYQLALEQIARGKHDAAFAAFVYQEQNKTTQMELQCRQCLNLPQTK